MAMSPALAVEQTVHLASAAQVAHLALVAWMAHLASVAYHQSVPTASEVPSSCPFASAASGIAIETFAAVAQVLFAVVVVSTIHSVE